MYFCGGMNSVRVLSGKSNGRSTYDALTDGKAIITGVGRDGSGIQRTVIFSNNEVQRNILKVNGKTVHHVAYGQFEKTKNNGNEIIRFKCGTGKAKHGKSRREEPLFGHNGVCHSWYKNGRLVRQKFIYDNRKYAYDYSPFKRQFTVKDYDSNVLYEIQGALDGRNNSYNGGHSVLSHPMEEWFLRATPFEVKKNGRILFAGHVVNEQRVGKWVIAGKPCYYERGVKIPQDLYETPPEKLDPVKILKIENAQLRMALASKIGPERIAAAGKVIHKDKAMRLYDIPGYDVRILRVQCPTTKAFYFLRVPKDAKKCEEARQWTFYVGDGITEPIKFKKET